MNFIEATVFLLFLAILSVPLANRLRVPFEIFLVIGSCLISLIPGIPSFQVNPVIVFNLFLPPILFSAAYFTSWPDFKFNLRPITLLAFGLVITTTVVVAVLTKLVIPGFTWGEGFLLGAIVSPTDASSAVAIIKKLGAPKRLITLLEGESLVNDATALILFRFSLASIMLGPVSLGAAIGHFIVVILGGAAVGFILGYLSVFIVKRINDARAETTLTFITAFASYFIAEHFHVSGVISTVVAGIYFGLRFPEYAPSQTRVNATASWNTLLFIVNGFVFTLIGLELPWILKSLRSYPLSDLLFYGSMVTLAIIAVRVAWVFPAAYFPRVLIPAIAKRDPLPPWQMLFTLGWSGMRGIVSLAAVLAIPLQTASGLPFPHRDLLNFITYFVIVATLLLPTFTLPYLIKIFHLIDDPKQKIKEEALARVSSLEGVLEKLKVIATTEKIPTHIFNEFYNQIQRRINTIQTQLEENPYSTLNEEYQALKRLTLAAIENERGTLIHLRKNAEIHDEIFHRLFEELDLEEMRAKSLRI